MNQYAVAEEVATFLTSCRDDNQNGLVIMGRQQGKTTILREFLSTLRNVTIGVACTNKDRYTDLMAGVNLHPSVNVSYVGAGEPGKLDFVVIDEAFYVPPEKMDKVTRLPYIAITTRSRNPPELANLHRVLDRTYVRGDPATEAFRPPWMPDIPEFLDMYP